MTRVLFLGAVLLLSVQSNSLQAQAPRPDVIRSEFTRFIAAPREKVYGIVANLDNHPKLLPNIRGRVMVPKSDITAGALAANEVLTISVAIEPQDRIAIAKFKFDPPRLIEEEMFTNPLAADVGTLDRKRGKVEYRFEEAPGGTRFTAVSEFFPSTGQFYNRQWIDTIWMRFLDNLEREATR